MRCYYEELCIPRDSNDADIKAAYRKMALRWHPDKNPDCLEEAKERFQLIQQAYEILSDAHERAWYDNHRDQILRGKNSEYEENSLDLFQYFTVSCYKGYGDEPTSFYSVYREVFGKLAAEDREFMDDPADFDDIPNFGKADSNYEEVVGPFYAYWQAYSTKKTYEWLCPYDILEIKDRYVLRKVEKEMKKIVQKARKERNEEVRNLVSFIRKRDRRVVAYRRVLEERAELNRQKQEHKRKEQLRKRQEELTAVRQKNNALNDNYEEQLKQLEQEYGGQSDEYDDSDEEANSKANSDGGEDLEDTYDDLYCVACNKSFKNGNAFTNHEESKKHRENVERLRLEFIEEEEAYNENLKANGANAPDSDCLEDTEEALNELHLNEAQSNESEAENISITQNKRNRRKKIKKSTITEDGSLNEPTKDDVTTQQNAEEDSNADDWSCNNKKSGKKSKNKKNKLCKTVPETEDSAEPKPTVANINGTTTSDDYPEIIQHICVTCKSSFESKNKLFAHLKKTNHGVFIPKTIPIVEGKTNKAKGKRR